MSSKRITYCQLNPSMSVHRVYTEQGIGEHGRIAFTRLRTSAHRLRIETGRWSRIARENPTCRCDNESVQTEEHVFIHCSLVRENVNNSKFSKYVFQHGTLSHKHKLDEFLQNNNLKIVNTYEVLGMVIRDVYFRDVY